MDISSVFHERLPKKPYCSNEPSTGLFIRPASLALKHRHIQPNPPMQTAWLIFDLDYAGAAYAWELHGLPPPTLSVINPVNAHAHLLYGLTAPVTVSERGRDAPIRFAAAIESAFHAKLKADAGYAGLITKNPFHDSWKTLWVNKLYDLNELAEYVILPKSSVKRQVLGLGRNCSVFDQLRVWTYDWVLEYKRNGANSELWRAAVFGQAEKLNKFQAPLMHSELNAIAKSVASWTWKKFSNEAFSAIQSRRGRLGGRPKTTTKDEIPWNRLGVSRATYYRKMRGNVLGS